MEDITVDTAMTENQPLTIFDEQIALKPNRYPWADAFRHVLQDNPWTVRKFKFTSDIQDFKVVLTEQEREAITRVLSAIGQIEIQVKEFWRKLGDNLPNPPMKAMGVAFANVEDIHGDAYIALLEQLGIYDIFEENLKLDFIKGRVTYLNKHSHKYYSNSKKQFLYAMILFSLFVENVSLFSQFYVINWFNSKKSVLTNTDQQVKYTRNEETIHALGGVKIVNTMKEEIPELWDQELIDKIKYEAGEAFKSESKIVEWMLNGVDYNIGGDVLNEATLKEFIKDRINASLGMIGISPLFDIDETLIAGTEWFNVQLLGNNMTDFFHGKDTSYSKNNKSFDADDLFD
jgi:ribonucleoside-diphosphate reductase beta chain